MFRFFFNRGQALHDLTGLVFILNYTVGYDDSNLNFFQNAEIFC
jgi:hypothetical protein